MAAGLGFKTFTTGEVLTAADTNGYLMQGVLVFANATARDAAITSPQEGQFAYLKDTNVTTYYTGSAWANLDTTGMTNPMTTTGDVIYSSSGSTPARLGIGTASQVLAVNSGATAPEWVTPAGGAANWSLLNSGGTNLTGATTVTVSGISGKDKIMVLIGGASSATATSRISVQLNADTGSNYFYAQANYTSPASYAANNLGNSNRLEVGDDEIMIGQLSNQSSSIVSGYVLITGCNSAGVKVFNSAGSGEPEAGHSQVAYWNGGYYNSATVISSVSVRSSSGNLDAGKVFIYTSA